jgi:ribosome biogenesis GTPase
LPDVPDAPEVPEATPVRVARVDLGQCTVLTSTDSVERAFVPHGVRVAVGDWVVLDAERIVTDIVPRTSAFTRGSAGQETTEQVVAANVDTVLIVNALDARLSLRRIERYLALGWQSGAAPVVLLTKADLLDPADVAERTAEVNGVALGVPVHVLSAFDDDSLRVLDQYLEPGRTVALLGMSGAGKSTLVNKLAGNEAQATQDVRSDGKGRHTTTHRELIMLPSGAMVIDTPGMRGLAMWETAEGVEQAFADVTEAAQQCRFSDCSHEIEPGCEVLAAVAEGRLDAERVASWHKLQGELRHVAERQDARLRQERQQQSKAQTKSYRHRPHR